MTYSIQPIDGDLSDLAERINHEHAACESALRSGLAHALEVGRLLMQAKARVPHGGWLPWVRANCRFSERTAQGYMRVASRRAELEAGDPQRVADLPYREALAMLAGPPREADAISDLAKAEASIGGGLTRLATVRADLERIRADMGPERFAGALGRLPYSDLLELLLSGEMGV